MASAPTFVNFGKLFNFSMPFFICNVLANNSTSQSIMWIKWANTCNTFRTMFGKGLIIHYYYNFTLSIFKYLFVYFLSLYLPI